jgi:hypothetical protein
MTEPIQVLVEPVDEASLPADRVGELAARHPRVAELLGELDPGRLVVGEAELLGRERGDRSPFRATVFDPASNRAVELAGRLDAPEQAEVRPSAFRPVPRPEELRRALDVLRRDGGFSSLAGRQDVVVYQPMPPLADLEREDGTAARRPTLGIYDPSGSPRHRIVAVDLAEGVVDWSPQGVDGPTDDDCESHLPVGVDSLPDAGGPDRVRLRVLRGAHELWNLLVVRPRNSSPQTYGKGSGVELRTVSYRGRLLLWQAHVPILNVLYDDGVTYRDWQNQETPFQAVGDDPVGPGWRLCSEPPATILEAGTDVGDFQGVALWYEDGELRIVSEVQAGWYRYVSDWRLRDDGVIAPRFGFAGTRNPRTCMRHQHHVYWRLDFDIEGAGNDVVQQRGLFHPGQHPWQPIVQETSRKRTILSRGWRVLDKQRRRGYRIVPGLLDGTADAYGVADLWFLRYHADELDDGVSVVGGSPAQTQTHLDQFLNGEGVDGTDVVVWYAGHFLHDEQAPSPHQGHMVGPELRPVNWD